MNFYRPTSRISMTVIAAVAAIGMTGCSMMPRPNQSDHAGPATSLVAFTTQLRASNEVPPTASQGVGSVDAVLNKDTNLLRWKANFSGLTGPATMAHFHGPADVGANAGVALPWTSPVASPTEGSATLTPAQVADLMAGRWYANIHTAANPGGEIRGQMTVRH